jgi:hypothetical protein
MSSVTPIVLPDEFNAASYFVDRHVKEGRADRVAIECGHVQVTYRQLYERVNQVGNALRELGVRIEERVFLLLLDSPEFAASFFGAIKIGAIPVPINTLLKSADYEYLLNNSRARVAIVSESLLPALEAIPRHRLRYLETTIVVGGEPRTGTRSELGVLRLGLLQDGDVGIGVFPEREEILIGRAGFGRITLHGIGAGKSEAGQCATRKVHHHSSVVNELLKFRCRSVAVVEHEIGFPTQINWAQEYRELRYFAKFDRARHLQ